MKEKFQIRLIVVVTLTTTSAVARLQTLFSFTTHSLILKTRYNKKYVDENGILIVST